LKKKKGKKEEKKREKKKEKQTPNYENQVEGSIPVVRLQLSSYLLH
jgi:hypothetical protein